MNCNSIGLLISLLILLSVPVNGAQRSINDVVRSSMGQSALERIRPKFELVGIRFPPAQLTLLATKNTHNLEIWAANSDGNYKYINHYRILAASGRSGPKMREGDHQVPEGIYRITKLNPNSAFHLSMKINYPNRFDRLMASREGRTNLGSNIFIHGDQVSKGCLAIGDKAIEELFVAVQAMENRPVIIAIAPRDPRMQELKATTNLPEWTNTLYRRLSRFFDQYHYLVVPKTKRQNEDSTSAKVLTHSLNLGSQLFFDDKSNDEVLSPESIVMSAGKIQN